MVRIFQREGVGWDEEKFELGISVRWLIPLLFPSVGSYFAIGAKVKQDRLSFACQ